MEKAPEAFRTISEVAEDLDIPQHVLRFWESRFSHIKPMKRGGGRRYYRPEDVALLRGIRHLLYGQGYTIRGVQRILREQGVRFVQTVWEEGAEQLPPSDRDADAPDEAASAAMFEGARPPEPARERREPIFTPSGEAPSAAPPRGPLTARQRHALQTALGELAECQRLLDAAINET